MRILTDDECDRITGGYSEPTTLSGLPASMPQPMAQPFETGHGRGLLGNIGFVPLDPMVFMDR